MTDWKTLVRDYGPMVFGTAWRILGQADDAEDVVQDVFLEAHRLRQTGPVDHWGGLLRRMATYRALDRLRQRKPAVPLEGVPVAETGDNPEATAVGRELEERLRRAVDQLPQRESAVFCLRYFEELSYKQIAETLEMSDSAVSTALNKARGKLQALLCETAEGET